MQVSTMNIHNFAEINNQNISVMKLFRSHKTAKEISPSFLLEKEVVDSRKVYQGYCHRIDIFLMWLESQGLKNTPLRKITRENITDFFYYLGREKKFDKPTSPYYTITANDVFSVTSRYLYNYFPNGANAEFAR